MSILFWYYKPIISTNGGVERVTDVLATYFKDNGYRVFFLSFEKMGMCSDCHYFLPNSEDLMSVENLRYAENLIFNKRISIIINQNGLSPLFSKFIFTLHLDKIPVKIISVIHNSLLSPIKNYAIVHSYPLLFQKIFSNVFFQFLLLKLYYLKYSKHFQYLFKKSECTLFLSPSYLNEAVFFQKNISMSKIGCIPNPASFINQGLFESKSKEVLYVGRLDFSLKKIDYLLDIWEIVSSVKKDWSLRIVGGGDNNRAKAYADKRNLNNIIWCDFCDPTIYYKHASIFCLTSSYEGFPMVLIEALTYGVVPIAFASFEALQDIIKDGINGFVITPFDKKKYADRLIWLMDNKEELMKMSHAGFSSSLYYSLESVGSKWLKLFKNIS